MYTSLAGRQESVILPYTANGRTYKEVNLLFYKSVKQILIGGVKEWGDKILIDNCGFKEYKLGVVLHMIKQ